MESKLETLEDSGVPEKRDRAPVGEEMASAGEVRTPPDPTPLPVRLEDGSFDLHSPEVYLNREMTWLTFNYRVD